MRDALVILSLGCGTLWIAGAFAASTGSESQEARPAPVEERVEITSEAASGERPAQPSASQRPLGAARQDTPKPASGAASSSWGTVRSKAGETASAASNAAAETADGAWRATKSGAEYVKEKSSEAWDATKRTTARGWEKTKSVTRSATERASDAADKAWDATKSGSQALIDKSKAALGANGSTTKAAPVESRPPPK